MAEECKLYSRALVTFDNVTHPRVRVFQSYLGPHVHLHNVSHLEVCPRSVLQADVRMAPDGVITWHICIESVHVVDERFCGIAVVPVSTYAFMTRSDIVDRVRVCADSNSRAAHGPSTTQPNSFEVDGIQFQPAEAVPTWPVASTGNLVTWHNRQARVNMKCLPDLPLFRVLGAFVHTHRSIHHCLHALHPGTDLLALKAVSSTALDMIVRGPMVPANAVNHMRLTAKSVPSIARGIAAFSYVNVSTELWQMPSMVREIYQCRTSTAIGTEKIRSFSTPDANVYMIPMAKLSDVFRWRTSDSVSVMAEHKNTKANEYLQKIPNVIAGYPLQNITNLIFGCLVLDTTAKEVATGSASELRYATNGLNKFHVETLVDANPTGRDISLTVMSGLVKSVRRLAIVLPARGTVTFLPGLRDIEEFAVHVKSVITSDNLAEIINRAPVVNTGNATLIISTSAQTPIHLDLSKVDHTYTTLRVASSSMSVSLWPGCTRVYVSPMVRDAETSVPWGEWTSAQKPELHVPSACPRFKNTPDFASKVECKTASMFTTGTVKVTADTIRVDVDQRNHKAPSRPTRQMELIMLARNMHMEMPDSHGPVRTFKDVVDVLTELVKTGVPAQAMAGVNLTLSTFKDMRTINPLYFFVDTIERPTADRNLRVLHGVRPYTFIQWLTQYTEDNVAEARDALHLSAVTAVAADLIPEPQLTPPVPPRRQLSGDDLGAIISHGRGAIRQAMTSAEALRLLGDLGLADPLAELHAQSRPSTGTAPAVDVERDMMPALYDMDGQAVPALDDVSSDRFITMMNNGTDNNVDPDNNSATDTAEAFYNQAMGIAT